MIGTLPLFDDSTLPPPSGGEPAPSAADTPPASGAPSAPVARGGVRASENLRSPAPRSERHLRAAWKLSRSMRRFPDGSAEQTRAGLAICRHLQALLAESGD